MKPPTLYGPNVDEYPQEFISEVSKILLSIGLSTSEKDKLATYQLKDLAQAWLYNVGIIGHRGVVW